MKSKMAFLMLFGLGAFTSLKAEEVESDSKTYMKAAMARSTLSYCLLVGKSESKQAQSAYSKWFDVRKEAIARVASQGCGQMCQMMGDPMKPLEKPVVVSTGPFAMSAAEVKSLCDSGMAMVAESVVATIAEPSADQPVVKQADRN